MAEMLFSPTIAWWQQTKTEPSELPDAQLRYGRTPIITGAGSGLGRDNGLGLAAKGYLVFGTAMSMELLPIIEKELAPFHARPHWGKLFTTSPATLKGIYTKMPDFIELAKKYDPQAKVRNDFLNKNIFLT